MAVATRSDPLAQPPTATRLSGVRTAVIGVILAAACGLAYHNSFEGPFIFDDPQSITQNPHARQLWPLTRSMTAPPTTGVAGRPIVSLSIAINYAIGGYDVRGYHIANLLFHVISTLLLFGVTRRTLQLQPARPQASNSSPGLSAGAFEPREADWVALSIALLWSVHPLLTESVTYVIQRTELLMGLFFLATLYCFSRGATTSAHGARTTWFTMAVLSCALGMGSKEVMVAAPIVVLIYDRLFLAGSFAGAVRQRWRVYLLLALTWLILPTMLFTLVALHSKSGAGFERLTVWDYLKTQAGVIVHYLRLAIWPDDLAIDYDDWPIAHRLTDVLPQALFVVALLSLTAYGIWRGRRLAFLGAWFFIILGPTSSFLPLGTEVAGERRMYLPTASVVALAVLAGRAALAWAAARFAWRPSSVRLAGGLVVLLLAAVMIGATTARNETYRDDLSIYADALAKRPNNARAMMNLGVVLVRRGERQAARQSFERAIALKPGYTDAHYNLGVMDLQDGRPAEAIAHFARATNLDRPTWPKIFAAVADRLAKEGRMAEAREMYAMARELAERSGDQALVAEIDAKTVATSAASK